MTVDDFTQTRHALSYLHDLNSQYEHFVAQVSSIIYLSVLLCVGWLVLAVIHSITEPILWFGEWMFLAFHLKTI